MIELKLQLKALFRFSHADRYSESSEFNYVSCDRRSKAPGETGGNHGIKPGSTKSLLSAGISTT